jgi:hypothetical protein
VLAHSFSTEKLPVSLGSDGAHSFLCLDFSLFGFTLKEGSEINQCSWSIRVRRGRERDIRLGEWKERRRGEKDA